MTVPVNTRVQGFAAPGFEPVADHFAQSFANGVELGAGVCVRIGGETVIDLTGGFADRAKTVPFDAETLVPVYSTTKGIAALMMAHAAGDLPAGYDTAIASLWPEFGVGGKSEVTIGDWLSHQAGLPGFAEPIDPELWLDPPACAAALAALAPMWPPGSAHGYHPTSWGYVAGEVFSRIMGRSLGTVLREDICAPHGIDFHIGLAREHHARCADIQRPNAPADLRPITPERRAAFLERWSGPQRGGAAWREIEIPSANGHGTAKSVAQLYELYLTRGTIGGRALIRGDVFERLITPFYDSDDLVLPMRTSFGAGIMLNTHGAFGPNPGALGHCGWGGSMAVADGARDLVFAYVMNKQSNILVGDPRAVALLHSVYGCL